MTDAARPTPPVTNARRWPFVLLVASLALNAMLAGAVLRSLWHMRASVAMTGGGVETSLPAFVDSLPANRREALRHNGQVERPGFQQRPLRMEIRRARAEAARIFTSDPFDKQAFIAAQNRLFEAESQLRLTIQRSLPEIGEQMTAAERRAYLSWRAPHGFNGRRPGGRGGRFDEPGGGPMGKGEDGPRRP